MMKLPFIKMQGLGNDFIVIDDLGPSRSILIPLTSKLAQKLCNRRFGIGADQLLWLKTAQDPSADVRMEIFNADGSVAEMCGNGIRVVALHLSKQGLQPKPFYRIETLGGVKEVHIQDQQIAVNMGMPQLGRGFASNGEILEVQGQRFCFFEVSVGNPHAVLFFEDLECFPIIKWGPWIESHSRFPQKTNVEFVQVSNSSSLVVKVWERGAGLTLACGTGACAAAIAALSMNKVVSPVKVQLPGGILEIEWSGENNAVWMKGTAEEVFRGEVVTELF